METERAGLPIRAFADAAAWEQWLAGQPRDSRGVWLKLAKAGAGVASVSKAEAIDAALCHGWIDGQLNPFDDDYWLIRFTPRKGRSKWSEKNRARAIELIADGRVSAAGQAEIDAAKADGRWDAAYAPQSTAAVPDDLAAALDAEPGARAFFDGARFSQSLRDPLPRPRSEEARDARGAHREVRRHVRARRDGARALTQPLIGLPIDHICPNGSQSWP